VQGKRNQKKKSVQANDALIIVLLDGLLDARHLLELVEPAVGALSHDLNVDLLAAVEVSVQEDIVPLEHLATLLLQENRQAELEGIQLEREG